MLHQHSNRWNSQQNVWLLNHDPRFIFNGSGYHFDDGATVVAAGFIQDENLDRESIGPTAVDLQPWPLVLGPEISWGSRHGWIQLQRSSKYPYSKRHTFPNTCLCKPIYLSKYIWLYMYIGRFTSKGTNLVGMKTHHINIIKIHLYAWPRFNPALDLSCGFVRQGKLGLV